MNRVRLLLFLGRYLLMLFGIFVELKKILLLFMLFIMRSYGLVVLEFRYCCMDCLRLLLLLLFWIGSFLVIVVKVCLKVVLFNVGI